jgi:hypothetical protein
MWSIFFSCGLNLRCNKCLKIFNRRLDLDLQGISSLRLISIFRLEGFECVCDWSMHSWALPTNHLKWSTSSFLKIYRSRWSEIANVFSSIEWQDRQKFIKWIPKFNSMMICHCLGIVSERVDSIVTCGKVDKRFINDQDLRSWSASNFHCSIVKVREDSNIIMEIKYQ